MVLRGDEMLQKNMPVKYLLRPEWVEKRSSPRSVLLRGIRRFGRKGRLSRSASVFARFG